MISHVAQEISTDDPDFDDGSESTHHFIDPSIIEKEKELLLLNDQIQAQSKKYVKEAESLLQRVSIEDSQDDPKNTVKTLVMEADIESNLKPRQTAKPLTLFNRTKSNKRIAKIDEISRQRSQPNSNGSATAIHGTNQNNPYDPLDGFGETEGEIDATSEYSQAAFRFLKAKVQVLMEELGVLEKEIETKDDELSVLKKNVKEMETAMKSAQTAQTQANAQSVKLKRENTNLQETVTKLRMEYESMSKELEDTIKASKKQIRDTGSRDVKLNRMAEELDRFKTLYQESRSHVSELQQAHAAETQAMSADIKRLDRQKQEIAQAFKKQSQLVAVLKKQKIHLEASAWLKLTEREFLRNLDWASTNNLSKK